MKKLEETVESTNQKVIALQSIQELFIKHPQQVSTKPYPNVNIGDKAYYCEDDMLAGIVVWKGKASELTEDSIIDWGMTAEEIDENYDLVIIAEDTGAPDDWDRLYNYDCDPCGVYCKV